MLFGSKKALLKVNLVLLGGNTENRNDKQNKGEIKRVLFDLQKVNEEDFAQKINKNLAAVVAQD